MIYQGSTFQKSIQATSERMLYYETFREILDYLCKEGPVQAALCIPLSRSTTTSEVQSQINPSKDTSMYLYKAESGLKNRTNIQATTPASWLGRRCSAPEINSTKLSTGVPLEKGTGKSDGATYTRIWRAPRIVG